jgi:hypothetical protein
MLATMGTVTVYDVDAITVWCNAERQLIHHKMHKFCAGEPFRAALTAGTEAMMTYRANKWLSDDRANGALSPEDETWATTTWFPRTVAAGWKHWAVVLPKLVVGQMNVGRFVTRYRDLGINAKVFADPDSAAQWLATTDDSRPPSKRHGSAQ